jgi:uncharacterized protein (TIGR00255 family)
VARSVNHRALDLNVRVREPEAPLEPVLRRVFSRALDRGKVDVALRLRPATTRRREIAVDEGLLEAVVRRVQGLAGRHPIQPTLTARDLFAIPQLFTFDDGGGQFTGEEIAAVERLGLLAATALIAMRESEGGEIARDLGSRVEFLRLRVRALTARREEIARAVAETLRERLRLLFPEVTFDPGRLEQEAALIAERSDVAEELQRLEAHVEQFGSLLKNTAGAIGKKLDFLAQEILRELNTLGAKARDLRLTREVLDMKSETEKIREQVQNLE